MNLQSNSVDKLNSQGLLESDSSEIVAAKHFVNPDKMFEILTEIKDEIKEEPVEDCEAEVSSNDNDPPDSPKLSHQKTPKNATPPTVKSPLVRRKSAKESNLDSDSDSDVEWKSNKKSPRKSKSKQNHK